MKIYTVPVYYTVCETFRVKAESAEQAVAFLNNEDSLPVDPSRAEYLDDSFNVGNEDECCCDGSDTTERDAYDYDATGEDSK